MRRISQQEWENEHMHNPMTEGEALAVLPDYDAGLLNDYGGGNVEWWQDYLRAEIGRANDYWRENIATLTAHTAASSGEVVAWALFDPMGGKPEILTCKERPYSLDSWQPLYRRPPAAVPADALERLVAEWRVRYDLDESSAGRDCTDELAALIPKGAV